MSVISLLYLSMTLEKTKSYDIGKKYFFAVPGGPDDRPA